MGPLLRSRRRLGTKSALVGLALFGALAATTTLAVANMAPPRRSDPGSLVHAIEREARLEGTVRIVYVAGGDEIRLVLPKKR